MLRAWPRCATAPPRATPACVIVTTLGTGIGTAVINDGVLLPNTELGHLEIDGYDAEKRAAASAKTREDLSYKEWSKRLQRYYETLEKLFWPDLFVVGGGVSKHSAKFLPNLTLNTPIVPAKLRNSAGIIGAAALAIEAVAARATGTQTHSVEDAVREEVTVREEGRRLTARPPAADEQRPSARPCGHMRSGASMPSRSSPRAST